MRNLILSAPAGVSMLALCVALAPVEAALAEREAGTTVFAGAEVDDQDSQRFDLGLSLLTEGGTGFDLFGSWTDTEVDTGDLSSTYVFGLVNHDFGRFGVGAGVRHFSDEDYSETLSLLGNAFYDFDNGRLSATIEARDTDFDPFEFTLSGADAGMPEFETVTGIADCSTDSLGYGLGIDVNQGRWGFYAHGSYFDYDDADCDVDITSTTGGAGLAIPRSAKGGFGVGPGMGGPGGPGTGPGGGGMTPLVGFSSTVAPREAILLESSIMIGASADVGSRGTVGLEYYHDTEELTPIETDTLLGYYIHQFTDVLGLELTVGLRDTDGYENATFVGLRLYASMGN